MITIDDKTYRNLQEQVGFNTEVINKLIKNTFLNIKGLVNTIGELPTTDIANGTFYLVGITKPYQLYIYFENKWINLGDFKVEALDGKNGEQGLPGHTPVITIGNNLNWFIDGLDTGVTAKGQNGISIRGPQGVKGDIGPMGPQGNPGINAFQFTVIDTLTSTDDLPSPLGTPKNYAYLVNDDLYIIIGDNSNLMWKNVGQLGGTIIQNYTVGNPEGQPSTALTKLQIDDKIFSVVSKDSDLFNSNQLAAINSGITSDSVKKIQNNTESINIINQNVNQLASTVESNKNDINSKVDELASATESALTQYNQMINSKQPLLVSGTNIKTINGNSILGSGNLDLLQDQKLDVSIECDHEYEITGKTGHEYGVAIEDSQMLLKKIQGQTRRYSLNLLNLPDMAETTKNGVTCSVSNGVVKVKGTNTASSDVTFNLAENMQFFGNDFSMDVGYDFTQLNNVNKFYVTLSKASYESIMLFNFNNNMNGFATKNNLNEVSKLSVTVVSGKEVDITLTPMLVSGIYTKDTMPPFQPYDDTLVNSKCNLISTGRNLLQYKTTNGTLNGLNYSFNGNIVRIKGTATADTTIYSDMNELLLNGSYYWRPNANKENNMPCALLYDNTTIMNVNNSSDILIELTNTKVNRMLWYIPLGTTIDYEANIMLNYGTQPSEYEPYTKEELPINVELGEYDYIDNETNLIVRQTSDLITYNGSSSSNFTVTQHDETNYAYAEFTNNYSIGKVFSSYEMTAVTPYKVVVNGWTQSGNEYTFMYLGNGIYRILFPYGTTLEQAQDWFKKQPFQVVFKLNTPTTEQISLPAGYAVYTGGLQQQVIKGKYLPYILHKLYSVSVPSQILANIEIDRAQQDMIYTYYQYINERVDRVVQGINAQIAQINKRLSQLEG